MEEQQLLIRISRDWADEFNVEGFVVWPASQWAKHLEFAEKYFKKNGEAEVYFGTNEALSWYSFEDYKNSFKVTGLSEEQHGVLLNLFSVKGYSWEHPKGKINVVPDKIKFGTIPMLDEEDKDDDD